MNNSTAAARKTLADFNADPHVRTWDCFTLETRYAVGSQSSRWASSPKIHLLRTEVVIGRDEEAIAAKPNGHKFYKVGSTFSSQAPCNSNGQHTGTPYAKLDTDAITCTKCLKWVEVK